MRVAFMGSKPLGVAVLGGLASAMAAPHEFVGVIAADDRDDVRSARTRLLATARDLGVPVEEVATTAAARAALEALAPDLVVVSGWYLRLPVEELPTRFLGLHASLLPLHRGFSPVVWQIIEGRDAIGLSFFELTAGIDEGDIVAQTTVPLGYEETVAEALERLERASVELVERHLPGVLDGTAQPAGQDHALATYCGPRQPEDGLVDWRWPARRVHDFVRAQTRPYPGAFTTLPDGRVLRLWRTALDPRPYVAVPGRVCERRPDAVVVGCGEGALRVLDAQVDGEASAPVEVILSSLRMRLGSPPS